MTDGAHCEDCRSGGLRTVGSSSIRWGLIDKWPPYGGAYRKKMNPFIFGGGGCSDCSPRRPPLRTLIILEEEQSIP